MFCFIFLIELFEVSILILFVLMIFGSYFFKKMDLNHLLLLQDPKYEMFMDDNHRIK